MLSRISLPWPDQSPFCPSQVIHLLKYFPPDSLHSLRKSIHSQQRIVRVYHQINMPSPRKRIPISPSARNAGGVLPHNTCVCSSRPTVIIPLLPHGQHTLQCRQPIREHLDVTVEPLLDRLHLVLEMPDRRSKGGRIDDGLAKANRHERKQSLLPGHPLTRSPTSQSRFMVRLLSGWDVAMLIVDDRPAIFGSQSTTPTDPVSRNGSHPGVHHHHR